MRTLLIAAILSIALTTGCSRPTAPSDTDQQQGNPNAQPEKNATSNNSKQPSDNQAGRDAHTDQPNKPEH